MQFIVWVNPSTVFVSLQYLFPNVNSGACHFTYKFGALVGCCAVFDLSFGLASQIVWCFWIVGGEREISFILVNNVSMIGM